MATIDLTEGDDSYRANTGDTVNGLSGNDVLLSGNSGGATAITSLAGGAGDDTYRIWMWNGSFKFADSTINVVEAADAGNDTVYAELWDYDLPENVENLVAGSFAIDPNKK
jgi:Ca2+-binding RTX toxin-like protein